MHKYIIIGYVIYFILFITVPYILLYKVKSLGLSYNNNFTNDDTYITVKQYIIILYILIFIYFILQLYSHELKSYNIYIFILKLLINVLIMIFYYYATSTVDTIILPNLLKEQQLTTTSIKIIIFISYCLICINIVPLFLQ